MEKININEFWEIIYALEKCYFDDLRLMNENTDEKYKINLPTHHGPAQSRLVGAGLMEVGRYGVPLTKIGSRIIHIMRDVL